MLEKLFKELTIVPGQYKMSHSLREHADVVSRTARAHVRLEVLLVSVQCKSSIQHDVQCLLLE